MPRAALAIALLCFWPCAARAEPLGCPAGMQVLPVAELMFGRNIGEVPSVTDAAWGRFLDEEITPRFPEGLTVTETHGQWREKNSGRIVREQGKKLTVIPLDADAEKPKLAGIAGAYKRAFSQESVLTIFTSACVGF